MPKELLRLLEEALGGRLIGIAADPREFLEQLPLVGGQGLRNLDVHPHELVTLAAPAQAGHAFAAQAEGRAALRGGGNLERGLAEKRGHLDRAAERRERELDGISQNRSSPCRSKSSWSFTLRTM
jgi:hypothetical protein